MQVKMNKEIRSYRESVFFGLSLRQFMFSMVGVLVAVGIYFFLKPMLGGETVSWLCILGALPFAVMGFVSYHGMTAEKLMLTWIRSELLEPRQLPFKGYNLYYQLEKEELKKREREEYRRND